MELAIPAVILVAVIFGFAYWDALHKQRRGKRRRQRLK